MRPTPGVLLFALSSLPVAAVCGGFPRPAGQVRLERIAPDETVPLDLFGTFTPSVSRGCRFVSVTSNHQVYVYDRRNRRFVLASARVSGEPATYSSHGGLLPGGGRLSEDGGRVAFTSMADNLAPGGPRLLDQVYVRQSAPARIWRVSQSSAGEPGNRPSRSVRLSGDGTVVAFVSAADNLVEGDGNGVEDVFLHDLRSGETIRISEALDGGQSDGASYAPSLAATADCARSHPRRPTWSRTTRTASPMCSCTAPRWDTRSGSRSRPRRGRPPQRAMLPP